MTGKIKLRLRPNGHSYMFSALPAAYIKDGWVDLGLYEFTPEELMAHRVKEEQIPASKASARVNEKA